MFTLKARGRKASSLKEALRNEKAAIDLASIMVGVIVIGLIGGVISATVFAVIPWSQDNAAKQQLSSVASAQSAFIGLSSSGDLPEHLPKNSFANSYELKEANLLAKGETYCTIPTNDGKGYEAYSYSPSGTAWVITDTNTSPQQVSPDSIPSSCGPILPRIDETPKLTTLTYKCATTKTGVIPMSDDLTGKETWKQAGTPVTERTYANAETAGPITLHAGVEYEVTFNGTYKSFDSTKTPAGGTTIADCLQKMSHWGAETGVTSAANAFYGATNLTSVPRNIPTTINNFTAMFWEATNFNDPNINHWDTSNVTNMTLTFIRATSFNQPLDNWDTSNVTSFSSMFQQAPAFNQPLNDWDTSKLRTLNQMFNGAKAFNQPIDHWDTSNVRLMSSTFAGASGFNQPIGNWDVTKATTMTYMFAGAHAFNQDLSNWNTASLTDYTGFSSGSFPISYLPLQIAAGN